MSKKAVYSNKGLQVYITADHFKELLAEGTLDVQLYIGKVQVKRAWCVVKVLPGARDSLVVACQLEQGAIDKARNEYSNAFAKRSQSLRNSNKE